MLGEVRNTELMFECYSTICLVSPRNLGCVEKYILGKAVRGPSMSNNFAMVAIVANISFLKDFYSC